MIGERFTRLVVIERLGTTRSQKRLWRCRCDCGNDVSAATGSLRSGNTKSCGCLKLDQLTRHGQHETRTYRIWQAMLNRCRQDQFKKYYDKITICERWNEFANFLADMGPAPDGLSIDRKDNTRGYEPENCRWATQTEQVRNTRRRTEYEHNGQRRSLIEWAEELGISHERLRGRIRRGWRFEDAIARN